MSCMLHNVAILTRQRLTHHNIIDVFYTMCVTHCGDSDGVRDPLCDVTMGKFCVKPLSNRRESDAMRQSCSQASTRGHFL